MALNLEKQLVFYGQYHHNPVNVAIHITCVPILLLTGFLLATNSPVLPFPSWLTLPNLEPNLGTIACLGYSIGYVLMEPVAGALLLPFLLAGTAYSNYLTSTYGMKANHIAIAVHIVSWIAQFIGHGKFEGRAPALLDNLVQALFLAPLFVWLEVLFYFGYRPELKARLDQSVKQEIAKWNAEKAREGMSVNGHANGKTN